MRHLLTLAVFACSPALFAADPPQAVTDAIAVLKDNKSKVAAKIEACDKLQASGEAGRPALEQLIATYSRTTDATVKTSVLDAAKKIDKDVYEALLAWPALPKLKGMKKENAQLFRDYVVSAANSHILAIQKAKTTDQKNGKAKAQEIAQRDLLPCVKSMIDAYPEDPALPDILLKCLAADGWFFHDPCFFFLDGVQDKKPFGEVVLELSKIERRERVKSIGWLPEVRTKDSAKAIDAYLLSLRNEKNKGLREAVDAAREKISANEKK